MTGVQTCALPILRLSDPSRSFLLWALTLPGAVWGEDLGGEARGRGLGEMGGGRAWRGGEGTERGLGEEQRERGWCWGEEGRSLGGLGEAGLG